MENSKKQTILVVDDSPFNLQIVSDMLNQSGYNVIVANDGIKALKYLNSNKPDLILLDIMMPIINGYDVCIEIKKDSNLSDIPVIFITAKSDVNDVVMGYSVGGVDYVIKPFNILELKTRIKNHLDLKTTRDKLKFQNDELNKKIVELHDANIQLIQKEKMAAIGQLAAGVAHEINNPLSFIMSNTSSLKKYTIRFKTLIQLYKEFIIAYKENNIPDLELTYSGIIEYEKRNKIDYILNDVTPLLDETANGLSRVKEIVAALRSFSHIDTSGSFEEYDINNGITTTLIIVKSETKDFITIDKELNASNLLFANGGELNQVFLNLFINSIYAIKENKNITEGKLTIKTYEDGDYIVCIVADNGIGIDKDKQLKIFEPFFTTKPVGAGTGLGLSLAYDIVVKKHNGSISVESEPNLGTKFTIRLPISKLK